MNQEQKKGLVLMTTATVRKWGNSLAVRIPQEVSDVVKFADGVEIEMYVTEDKQLVLRPAFPAADDNKSLRELFLSLRGQSEPGSDHEEMFADLVGDEIW